MLLTVGFNAVVPRLKQGNVVPLEDVPEQIEVALRLIEQEPTFDNQPLVVTTQSLEARIWIASFVHPTKIAPRLSHHPRQGLSLRVPLLRERGRVGDRNARRSFQLGKSARVALFGRSARRRMHCRAA